MKQFYHACSQYRIFSIISIIAISFFLVLRFNQAARWKDKRTIIHDVGTYYGYLPALFVYKDLKLKYIYDLDRERPDVRRHVTCFYKNGNFVFKMTSGCAFLWTPFFLATQAYLQFYPEDIAELSGYSRYNHFSLHIAALFYGLIGLILLCNVSNRYFSDLTTAILLVIVSAGSNLFYYIAYEPGMSHVYSFFLFALLLHFTIKWHQHANLKNSIGLAFTLGLITLVRPSNLIAVLIPLLWAVRTISDIRSKFNLIFSNRSIIISMCIAFILPLFPQFIYWKIATGNWIQYSYNKESFFFDEPYIWKGLFGFRKGWFIYTPLMILGIPGLIIAFRKGYDFALSNLVFFTVCTYVVFSWWCWWYGGSFGMRSMIDFYPAWMLLVGAMIDSMLRRGWISRTMLTAVVICGIHLNLFQTFQYTLGIIHFDGMNYKTYRAVWGKTRYPVGFSEMLDKIDYEEAMKGERK